MKIYCNILLTSTRDSQSFSSFYYLFFIPPSFILSEYTKIPFFFPCKIEAHCCLKHSNKFFYRKSDQLKIKQIKQKEENCEKFENHFLASRFCVFL